MGQKQDRYLDLRLEHVFEFLFDLARHDKRVHDLPNAVLSYGVECTRDADHSSTWVTF